MGSLCQTGKVFDSTFAVVSCLVEFALNLLVVCRFRWWDSNCWHLRSWPTESEVQWESNGARCEINVPLAGDRVCSCNEITNVNWIHLCVSGNPHSREKAAETLTWFCWPGMCLNLSFSKMEEWSGSCGRDCGIHCLLSVSRTRTLFSINPLSMFLACPVFCFQHVIVEGNIEAVLILCELGSSLSFPHKAATHWNPHNNEPTEL